MLLIDLTDDYGEQIGEGLDSGAVNLSGTDSFAEDNLGEVGEPNSGSSIDMLGTSTGAGVTDIGGMSSLDDFNLSGVSDPIASESLDSDNNDTNGTGSATSTHVLSSGSPEHVSSLFGGIAKFGTAIGQLFAKGSASTQPVIAGDPANANPNKVITLGITSGDAFMLLGVVIVIGAAIVLGGD